MIHELEYIASTGLKDIGRCCPRKCCGEICDGIGGTMSGVIWCTKMCWIVWCLGMLCEEG